LVLAVLWWTWTGYARLTNRLDPEEDHIRILMLAAVASMLIISLALPRVFGADGLTFALAYFVLRCLHVALLGLAAGDDPAWHRSALVAVPNVVATSAALIAASRVHGSAQIACWGLAAALSYVWPLLGHARGWEVSPDHFAERFGLVILIALGESVVAVGAGVRDRPLDAGVIGAALLGMTVVACLWWSYFDWVMYIARARLAAATGVRRATLARDAYAYIHSAMVAGIVLFAYGVETALHDTAQPLEAVPATALAGGRALYFLAHVALRLRIGGGLGRGRPVAAATTAGLIPVATAVAALATLTALAIVCVALVAYEVLRHREPRAAIRAQR
jgi:low temperature requirement protein LtrA